MRVTRPTLGALASPAGAWLYRGKRRVTYRVRLAALVSAVVLVSACAGGGTPIGSATPSAGPASPTLEPRPSASVALRTGAPTSPPSVAPTSPSATPSAPATTSASGSPDDAAVAAVATVAQPLEGPAADDDALMARLADAELVLLGEPSHGTQEAYEERARITERLIEEAGFSGLVIEGEWPAARRVDLYVRGLGSDVTAVDALGGFADFPDWMWRNRPFAELVEWLRERNAALPYEQQAGVYGLDLFSLPESVAAVPAELEPFDRAAATRVERLYECAGASGTLELEQDGRSCVASVQAAFERATAVAEDVGTKDAEAADEAFSAVQNARIVVNGRRYAIGEGGVTEPSWNVRDRHMVDTVAALRDHLRATGRSGRLLVWAHNSHVGDARVTSFADLRQVNLGQLVRERWPRESAIVGFSTYTGTVTAAQAWGLPGMTMEVLPALADSHHELLHRVAQSGVGDFYVVLGERAPAPLLEERIERFIGVLYLPLTERHSHYFTTRLSEEYDFVIHLDQTTALELLDEAVP